VPFNQFLPRPFDSGNVVTYAPVVSGLYGLSNSHEWVYIGEADNIRSALLNHLGDNHTSLMQHEPTGFVFEVCDRASRPSRQDRLVFEYGPVCNRSGDQPRR
jgi:hypothetical protein